jgi:hypothetical protein
MDYYYKFTNLDDCQEALNKINQRKGFEEGKPTETWSKPLKNQINNQWVLPFDANRIGDCIDVLEKGSLISKEDAVSEGWYFGFFSGSFAREKEKLEDIHFIFDALISSYGKPNFPATRSLIFSFLSACYSLKESFSKKIKASSFDKEFKDWWKIKWEEQNRRNELLKEYDIFMNTEKHGGSTVGQSSNIKLESVSYMSGLFVTSHHPHADPKTMIISSEGAFMTAYKDTPMERRFPVGIHDARYEIRVKGSPKSHLGQNIEGYTFLDQMTLIRNYYMQLIYDADLQIGEREDFNLETIQFSGTQFMEIK